MNVQIGVSFVIDSTANTNEKAQLLFKSGEDYKKVVEIFIFIEVYKDKEGRTSSP